MTGSDVFDLYRQLLGLVVGTYVVFRTANTIVRWQAAITSAGRAEATFLRYLAVRLLQVRLRRFVFDFFQIAVLLAALGYLLWLHWERALVPA